MKSIITVFALLLMFTGMARAQNGFAPTTPMDHFFAGAGPATFDNLDAGDVGLNVYGGKFWELTNMFALKALADVTTDFDQAVVASGNLGTNFYPIDIDYSPYLGGMVGVGYINNGVDDDVFGVDLGAQLGVQLFRGSDFQANVEAQVNTILNEITSGFPTTYSARLGVLF